MTTQSIYLLFDGNCKQGMEFYHSIFGGELTIAKVGDTPMKNMMPTSFHEKIINAKLVSGRVNISASDWLRPNQKPEKGNMVCIYLSGGSSDELKGFFEKLSVGADVTDPIKQEFHGTYGALNDKFGIRWMFQTDKK